MLAVNAEMAHSVWAETRGRRGARAGRRRTRDFMVGFGGWEDVRVGEGCLAR